MLNVRGEKIPIIKSVFPITLGGRECLLENFIDISARKEAEKTLRLTQFSVEKFSDGILWIGPDAKFNYANEAVCQKLGYSKDELLTMSVYDVDPDFPAAIWPQHWERVRQEKYMLIESRHRTKSGQIIPVELSINYLEFEGQQYCFTYIHDITHRKQIKEKLAKEQYLIDALMDNHPDYIYFKDREGPFPQD